MSYLVFLVLSHLLIHNVMYASAVMHWLFSYTYQVNHYFPIIVMKFQTLFISVTEHDLAHKFMLAIGLSKLTEFVLVIYLSSLLLEQL